MPVRWQIAQFMELRWWRRYLSGRDPLTYLTWKRSYWKRLLETQNLQPRPGAEVLDAGCGPAGIFTVLEDCRTDALDPLLAAYAEALPHFSPADYPAVRFITTALENFNPGKQYEQIFCLNALNHVANLPLCLDRLVTLLRPGGRLVISVDAHKYRRVRHLFQIFPGDVLHPHQFTPAEYRAMLEVRGCIVTRETVLKAGRIFDYVLLVAEPAPAQSAAQGSSRVFAH